MITGHVYTPRGGDREFVAEKREMFRSYSGDELITYYNDACSKGFFGVHSQALTYIALDLVFREKLGSSPFLITENVLIEFTGPIRATSTGWEHVETNEK